MRTERVQQIAVIHSDNANEFQKQFNAQMIALADKSPEVEFNHAQGFCAYITYTETTYTVDSIADEFHADGLKFTCRNCPLHEVETDGRKKRVKCKYADVGFCHLDHEACEVFYRRLMLREVEPIGEPQEYGIKKKAKYNTAERRVRIG